MAPPKLFVIVIDGGDSVFYAGDTISGRVKIQTVEKKKLRGIYLTLVGRANVCWAATLGNVTVTYTSSQEYFNYEVTLWGGAEDKQFLEPGVYQFPFSVKLPKEPLPSTYESCVGRVSYWLEAHMDRPSVCLRKRNVTISERVDLNLSEEDLVASRHAEKQKTLGYWCYATGPLTVTVSTNRAGYCPGESILVTARVENSTNKTMKGVIVTLYRRITCFVKTYSNSWVEFVAVLQSTNPIPAGGSFEWNQQPLLIPPCLPSSHTCGCLHTDYELDFEVVTPFFNTHLHKIIPIVIGTEPLQSVNANDPIPTIGWTHADQAVNIAGSQVEHAPFLPVLQLSQDCQQLPQNPRDPPIVPPGTQPRTSPNPGDPPPQLPHTQLRTAPNPGDPTPQLPHTQLRTAPNPGDPAPQLPHTQLRTAPNPGDPPPQLSRTQLRTAPNPGDPPPVPSHRKPRTTPNPGDPPPQLPRTQLRTALHPGDPPPVPSHRKPRTTPRPGDPPPQAPPLQLGRAHHPTESHLRAALAPHPAA